METKQIKNPQTLLENIIHKIKGKSLYFPRDTLEYDTDIVLLIEYIAKKYPTLLKQLSDIDIKNNRIELHGKNYVKKAYNTIFHKRRKINHDRFIKQFKQTTILPHYASNFEKNFKELIKTQGFASSPLFTAHTMIQTMPVQEKNKLNSMFTRMGIKSPHQVTSLLSKWKTEALMPKKNISRTRTLDINLER